MPKLKTSKSAAKRIIKVSKNGKIIRRKMSAQHRTKGKSTRTLLSSRKQKNVSKSDTKKIKKLIPYI